MENFLSRTPRGTTDSKDFGRRPELNVDIDPESSSQDGYQRMMRSTSVAEVDRRQKEKHSQFEKPYIRGMKYEELQSFHPSNWFTPYSIPRISPDIGGGIPTGAVDVNDCEGVWTRCLQQVCGNTTGCGGPNVVEEMRRCAGECTEPHRDILSCLFFNDVCVCERCASPSSPLYNRPICGVTPDEGCKAILCSEEPCPPFDLVGPDVAPATLCPSELICAANISGGDQNGPCIDVLDVGCGSRHVCITDACGNEVCKKVRMSTGVWVFSHNVCVAPCMDQFFACPTLWAIYPVCTGGSITCTHIDGDTKTEYITAGNTTFSCSLPVCPTSPCGSFYNVRRDIYRWVCP